MTIAAKSIIQRAVGILQDTTSVRWPVDELVRWLNDAQREVVSKRPDAMNTTATMSLSAGTRQNLDSSTGNEAGNAMLSPTPAKLIEITRNMAVTSAKGAVRLIPREILDAQTPGWHNLPGKVDVLHYMYDPRDPMSFYVYPPATAGSKLEVMYSAYPSDIPEPGAGAAYSDVTTNISLPDIYANALLDYVLYRAYSKDSTYAGNDVRAQAHAAALVASLGDEIKATLAVQPQMNPGARPN